MNVRREYWAPRNHLLRLGMKKAFWRAAHCLLDKNTCRPRKENPQLEIALCKILFSGPCRFLTKSFPDNLLGFIFYMTLSTQWCCIRITESRMNEALKLGVLTLLEVVRLSDIYADQGHELQLRQPLPG